MILLCSVEFTVSQIICFILFQIGGKTEYFHQKHFIACFGRFSKMHSWSNIFRHGCQSLDNGFKSLNSFQKFDFIYVLVVLMSCGRRV